MEEKLLYCAGGTTALRYAAEYLRRFGVEIADSPGLEVKALLLDVPSFGADGQLRCGGTVEKLLAQLPANVTVFGGNLDHPALEGYRTVDFLKDAGYLAENAYITAECALEIALSYLSLTLRRCPVLIIGWGRIGKCLSQLLKGIGADVTISARKETDRAMIRALGYQAVDILRQSENLSRYRLIFNTAPELILNRQQMHECHPDCVKIELASKTGIEGDDVVIARGLPGVRMPESSGKLIAKTFIRLCREDY